MQNRERNCLDLLRDLQGLSKAISIVTPSATVLVKSPFFLQPANNAPPGPRISQLDEGISDKPLVFPLIRLPTELQLRVLWHCLISSLPIVNAGMSKDNQVPLVKNETPGQRRISPAIIFTCKAYYHGGIKLLYSSSHFVFTLSSQTDVVRIGIRNNLSRIENIVLRPVCSTIIGIGFSSAATVAAMYWLRHLRFLKTLRIDFCDIDVEMPYPYDDEDYDSLDLLLESVDNVLVERLHIGGPTSGLSQLILTGLPEDDIGLAVVRAMSLLVRLGGQGWHGDRQRRYQVLQETRGLLLGQ
ncbi:MAG: hypothetical protein LQ338_003908 [Usnochroma carphineum]|nr:MAG: hypothetical protein LQ338_003908 [Usnochroma carphineum]